MHCYILKLKSWQCSPAAGSSCQLQSSVFFSLSVSLTLAKYCPNPWHCPCPLSCPRSAPTSPLSHSHQQLPLQASRAGPVTCNQVELWFGGEKRFWSKLFSLYPRSPPLVHNCSHPPIPEAEKMKRWHFLIWQIHSWFGWRNWSSEKVPFLKTKSVAMWKLRCNLIFTWWPSACAAAVGLPAPAHPAPDKSSIRTHLRPPLKLPTRCPETPIRPSNHHDI